MTSWDPGDKRQILQSIADDERRPAHEREVARRELAVAPATQPAPTSPRHGRNSGVPQSQQDLDGELENWYQRILPDNNLTCSDRREIRLNFDPSTQAIIDVFGNHILWLFGQNIAEIKILIDLHRRTQSDFVRAKTAQTIKWIADYTSLESAKAEAQQFLTQLDTTTQEKQ
jgi:hypothetical protein